LEAVIAAAGAAADSEVVALVVAAAVVDLVAVLAEVGTLVAEVRAAVGKMIRLIRENLWSGLSYG
jgi:hypothetical protein